MSRMEEVELTNMCMICDGKGNVLVQNKKNHPTWHGWNFPGGHVEKGEYVTPSVIREMKEETDLDVEIIRLLYLCDVSASDNTLLHITFLLKRIDGNIKLPTNEFESNPIYEVKFIPVSKLTEYGFNEKFLELAENGFAYSGIYAGDKTNIGLGG